LKLCVCVCEKKGKNGYNNCLSASQKSFFERTLKLKEKVLSSEQRFVKNLGRSPSSKPL
jgi:hypothetical protein